VLNTDNMNVTGESFDYGPYRFLPTFDPGFTAAYFDTGGLYAYGRQPATVQWNLERLADTLTPLATQAALSPALADFAASFRAAVNAAVLTRLGVASVGLEEDTAFVAAILSFLRESQVGMDRFFFDWYGGAARARRATSSPAAAAWNGPRFDALLAHVEAREPLHPERLSTPYFQGDAPCALLIDEIEALWAAVAERDDWEPLHDKLAAIDALRMASDPLV
jgi:uncharacterized protein YdiU (UPF0061 family)